jgi:hypothetical protein
VQGRLQNLQSSLSKFTILHCGYFFTSRITTWEALRWRDEKKEARQLDACRDNAIARDDLHEACATSDHDILGLVAGVIRRESCEMWNGWCNN